MTPGAWVPPSAPRLDIPPPAASPSLASPGPGFGGYGAAPLRSPFDAVPVVAPVGGHRDPGRDPRLARPAEGTSAAIVAFDDTSYWRKLIASMYQFFNPEKLSELDTILDKYRGGEGDLYQALCDKYNGGDRWVPGAQQEPQVVPQLVPEVVPTVFGKPPDDDDDDDDEDSAPGSPVGQAEAPPRPSPQVIEVGELAMEADYDD